MSDITINNALSAINGRSAFENQNEKKVVAADQNNDTAQKVSQTKSEDESKQKIESSEKEVHAQEKEVSEALKERNEQIAKERMDALNRQNIGLDFSVDKDTDSTIIKVTDLNTEKLVRQIPSEEFLEFADKLRDMQKMNQDSISGKGDTHETKGLLFDENV